MVGPNGLRFIDEPKPPDPTAKGTKLEQSTKGTNADMEEKEVDELDMVEVQPRDDTCHMIEDFVVLAWNIRGAASRKGHRFWSRVGYKEIAIEEAQGHTGGL
ncbi:hypothetical protein SESBI_02387 [Sesbania bispinosa]|nr:hypothetical protein SESBI_02387 [Sesbania bispinosa]